MSGVLRTIYRSENDFDFTRACRRGLAIAVIVSMASIISLITQGLNLGIDFEGGGVWEVPVTDVSVAEARDVLSDLGQGNAKIQLATNEADGTEILRVQAGVDALDRAEEITDALAELADASPNDVSVEAVGPSWGEEITQQAVRALIFFFIAITLYISVRLEWRMAIGALASMVHDLLLSVGVYSVFQLEVTPSTVIAFLTILGYSLYDTIVVFDKAQDNANHTRGRVPYRVIMSRSLNQTLMRSVNTTIATLLPIISMLLVGALLLGAETLEEFSVALFVGLASGAYSSIFVAAPVVTWLKEREDKYAYADDGAVVTAAPATSAPTMATPAMRRRAGGASTTAPPTPVGAIPPRPRKTKKRR